MDKHGGCKSGAKVRFFSIKNYELRIMRDFFCEIVAGRVDFWGKGTERDVFGAGERSWD